VGRLTCSCTFSVLLQMLGCYSSPADTCQHIMFVNDIHRPVMSTCMLMLWHAFLCLLSKPQTNGGRYEQTYHYG
jgi:hypothetical protein